MKLQQQIVTCMLCVVIFSGCTTRTGPRIDQLDRHDIRDGVTTQKAIKARLGKPQEIERTDEGFEKYVYVQSTIRNTMPTYCKVGIVLLYAYFIPACFRNYQVEDINRLSLVFDESNSVKEHYIDELSREVILSPGQHNYEYKPYSQNSNSGLKSYMQSQQRTNQMVDSMKKSSAIQQRHNDQIRSMQYNNRY